jgi:hypothetical protein
MSESQSEQEQPEEAADAEELPATEAGEEEAAPAPTTFTIRADSSGYVELKSGRKFVGLLQAGAELTYPIEEKPDV